MYKVIDGVLHKKVKSDWVEETSLPTNHIIILTELYQMNDEERLGLFNTHFCKYCGTENYDAVCHCWNDE